MHWRNILTGGMAKDLLALVENGDRPLAEITRGRLTVSWRRCEGRSLVIRAWARDENIPGYWMTHIQRERRLPKDASRRRQENAIMRSLQEVRKQHDDARLAHDLMTTVDNAGLPQEVLEQISEEVRAEGCTDVYQDMGLEDVMVASRIFHAHKRKHEAR